MKVTSAMIEAARQAPGDDVPEDAVRAALEAALAEVPAAKPVRPSPAISSRIVTTRMGPVKKVAIPKAVVWSKKPKPRR